MSVSSFSRVRAESGRFASAFQWIFAGLVLAALANGLYMPVGGLRMRPEHVAGPMAFGVLVVLQLLRKQPAIRWDSFAALALAWVGINALASWLSAPDPSQSLVHVVRLGLLAATFLTVANLPHLDSDAWSARLRFWLAGSLVVLLHGLLLWFFAQYLDVWLPGTYQESGLSGISIKSVQYERNLFGILAATVLAVAFYCLIAQRRQSRRVASSRFLLFVCALASGALVVSLTRSAWLATLLLGPAAYVLFDRRGFRRVDRDLVHVTVGLPIVLGFILGLWSLLPAPSGAEDVPASVTTGVPQAQELTAPVSNRPVAAEPSAVVERLSTIRQLESDRTVSTRVQDVRWAIDDWQESPVIGRGTGSFAQIHGSRAGSEAWVSNLILHTLLDTGIVGLGLQWWLFALVLARTWRAAGATTDARLAVGLKGLSLGFLLMLMAYQLTDGSWMAVFWVHSGLMVNGIYAADQGRRATQPTNPL